MDSITGRRRVLEWIGTVTREERNNERKARPVSKLGHEFRFRVGRIEVKVEEIL